MKPLLTLLLGICTFSFLYSSPIEIKEKIEIKKKISEVCDILMLYSNNEASEKDVLEKINELKNSFDIKNSILQTFKIMEIKKDEKIRHATLIILSELYKEISRKELRGLAHSHKMVESKFLQKQFKKLEGIIDDGKGKHIGANMEKN